MWPNPQEPRYRLMLPLVPSSNNFSFFLFEKRYALIYQVVVSRFFFEVETIRGIPRLIFTSTIYPRCHFRLVLLLHRNNPIDLPNWLICSLVFYTMTTLLISDTNCSYIIFDFLEDTLHLFPQVFNLSRLVSQKYNNKDTNWKTTQEQPQTILW